MHAVATMILVACSLPCAGGQDASSATAVQALKDAVAGAVLVADETESPGLLLDRGTALLLGGNSKGAVDVLDAAIVAWEEEVRAQ